MMGPMRLGPWLLALASLSTACAQDNQEGLDAGSGDGSVAPIWVVEPGIPTKEDLLSVWGYDAENIFAVGFSGTVLHYDGLAWNIESVSATVPLTSVHGLPKDTAMDPPPPLTGPVFAVGWDGTILMRDHASATWIDAAPSSTVGEDLFGVRIGADDSAIAVGDVGRLMVWDGTTWAPKRFRVPGEFTGSLIEPKTSLKGVWTRDGRRYYISGAAGAAYRSDNGYASFESIDTRDPEPLRGIWGINYGDVYAVGLSGKILHFDPNGDPPWRRVRNNGAEDLPSVFFFGIDGTGGNDITIVGWRGTAVRYAEGAWTIEPTGVDADLRSVWIDPETQVAYAVGASGTVIRRDPPPPAETDAGM